MISWEMIYRHPFWDGIFKGDGLNEVRNLGAEMSRFASKCKDENVDSTGISGKLSGLKILCPLKACGFNSRPGYDHSL